MCWAGTCLHRSLLGTAVGICKEASTLPARRVILACLSPAEGQKGALDSWIKAFQPEPFTGLFDFPADVGVLPLCSAVALSVG